MDAERDYYTKLAQRLLSGDGPAPAFAQRAKSPLIEQISHARLFPLIFCITRYTLFFIGLSLKGHQAEICPKNGGQIKDIPSL